MKAKIFLTVMMILFAVSCAKNNPANPVSSSNNVGNTSGIVNNSNDNNDNNGNTKDGNIDNTKNDIPGDIIEDGEPVKYKLNVTHIVETLDKVGRTEEKIDIDIYIYEDIKAVFLHIPRGVAFHNVKISNGKYEGILENSNGTYILSMTVSGGYITDFNLTIHGDMEKYYYKLK